MKTTIDGIDLEISFYEDWAAYLGMLLVAQGYSISAATDPQKIALQYFNAEIRKIPIAPRRFVYAKEFTCPSQHQNDLQLLQEKSGRGENLMSHQSRSIMDTEKYDPILFDWGIHHLHFTESGTQEILFCMVDQDTIYCIDVRSHGRSHPTVWGERDLLEIAYSNWSELFDRFKTPFENVFPKLIEPRHFTQARKAGMTIFVELSDGTVLMPPGGGYATAGNSMKALQIHDHYGRFLGGLQQEAYDNFSSIIQDIRTQSGYSGNQFKFRLIAKNDAWFIFESFSGMELDRIDGLPPF